MSRYFVTAEPVAVYETDAAAPGENVIDIRSKMDIAAQARVKSELLSLAADGKTPELHLGANELALLVHNIVAWRGPDLDGVPCDAAHIRMLDPTEPHLARVLAEITRRNAQPVSPNPKSAAGSGSPSAGVTGFAAAAAARSEPGIVTSRLPSDLDGRLSRSDGSILTSSTSLQHG